MSARKVVDQSAAVQDSRFTTTIYLEGYQYTRATTSARKTSYRCSYYRSAGCKGKVDLIARTKTFTNFTDHTVATAGIAWVKQQIKAKCAGAGMPYAQEQWRSFWVYFRRIWITQFPPALWNLHGLSNSIIARTSNPLEQFHRELDAAFTSQDPGLLFFVATVEKMARHHVADLAAETTTLPSAVEVFSEGEASSDEESIGDESDGDDDDDNVESFKCEPPLGRQSSVGNRDETATSLTKRST
ncbi:hypothetical protein PF010_g27198 [Phytophthora fragariae]|uniref:FLYWCH-type domain-containing protein n=1 Tax=Phytophthora fragariae TaxID=53985 RepID=A0A6G0JVF8_9STRA|nr:hypothetical protein PF010_g27198 [Phytophthora fragariae]